MNDTKLEAAMRPEGPPSGYFLLVPPAHTEDAVSLATVFSILGKSWKLLASAAFCAALISAAIALMMQNVYRAEMVIAPVTDEEAGKHGLGDLGGLASLAGIDLGANEGRVAESYATLTSRGFVRGFIADENLLPVLFASRWDPQAGRWRADKKPPTLEDGVKYFFKHVYTVAQDHKTGMVTVQIDWYSPQQAAAWANRMIETINDRLRAEAIHKADLSIDYLNKELAKNNSVEMQQAIYQVMEDKLNDAMMANVQRDYAFHIIDPAVVPETKHGPLRAVMTLVGGAVGGFLAAIFVFVRRAIRDRRAAAGGG
jgi:uncharacterized protein involved in exopolysaccharide biosynthesis